MVEKNELKIRRNIIKQPQKDKQKKKSKKEQT
jgi:hypothetical protein